MASKLQKLTQLAERFFGEGKSTDEVRGLLSDMVPGATAGEIERAVTPTTLAGRVERGKELSTREKPIEPVYEEPKPTGLVPVYGQPTTEAEILPTGTPGLVPIAPRRDIFTVSPEGSVTGAVSPTGGRVVDERSPLIKDKVPEAGPSPAPEETSRLSKLTMPVAGAATAGAGLVGAGYLVSSGKSGEAPREEKYKPVVTPDGSIGMSDAEYKEIESRLGTVRADKERASKYQDLNEQFQDRVKNTYKLARMEIPSSDTAEGRRALSQDASKFIAEIYQPKTQAAAPTRAVEKEAEQPAPPPSPMGGMTPAAPPVSEGSDEDKKKQGKTEDVIGSAQQDIARLQDALGANKQPSRKNLETLLGKLEQIRPDPNLKDPATRDFLAAKGEAFRAYREKADRNEWLDLAQNLVNALTQYASTQAAVGTGRVGGGLPLPSTDYGRRTEQAFREYQAQVADIGSEQRATEQEQERVDRLRREDIAAQRGSLGERIAAERERIRQEESDAKQAGRDAISLYSALQANKRAVEQNENNIQRAVLQYQQRQDAASSKQLENQIGFLANEETKIKRQLDAANELMTADKKQYEAKLANWAAAAGQNVDNIVKKAENESGFFTSKKDYIQETLAPQHANMLQSQLTAITNQLEQLRAAKYGGQPAAQPTPTQPASRPAAQTTTVPKYEPNDIVEQNGKRYRFKGGNQSDPANYELIP